MRRPERQPQRSLRQPASVVSSPPLYRMCHDVRSSASWQQNQCLADNKACQPYRSRHAAPFCTIVALAVWFPDKTLAKTCADFSDLEIGPDGCLYLLSDKSATIARLDELPAGGGAAALLDAWRLGDLGGKPEGLAFTVQGRAIVGLDTRKPSRNLVLLEPAVAQLRGRGQSLSDPSSGVRP
jgi:hypothetical protein